MNSKGKGNKNERNISKLFASWTGYPFERVPSSGGLRWAKKSDTVGDVICTDESHSRYFTFSIECKFYAEIDFSELLLPTKENLILDFWGQTTEDANRAKRIPILLMRYNRMPRNYYFVVISYEYYKAIKAFNGFSEFLNYQNKIVIFPSKTLFSWDYPVLHKFNKKYIKELYGKQESLASGLH